MSSREKTGAEKKTVEGEEANHPLMGMRLQRRGRGGGTRPGSWADERSGCACISCEDTHRRRPCYRTGTSPGTSWSPAGSATALGNSAGIPLLPFSLRLVSSPSVPVSLEPSSHSRPSHNGLHQYYAVIHPVRSRYLCTFSQARRVIIFIWIAAFLTALPIIFVQVHVEMGLRRRAYWCMRDEGNPGAWRSFEIYMFILVLCIPAVVMGYAYAKICAQLWMVVRERASLTTGTAVATEMTEKKPKKKTTFAAPNGDTASAKPSRADEDTVRQVRSAGEHRSFLSTELLVVLFHAPGSSPAPT
ncbi:hypothetical protein HPB48_022912 [Haemaphysalis longicornis]|uniref:G-protein coupled receptors family 1 profile domain-containing protein n=1 Tax=Haemaphysalis longicornis TaxID=44386 RepID=A0A9J6FIA9_HAELO|nr:hypothetical protein HPB48_022912 [Haemaphysalis longicornis]